MLTVQWTLMYEMNEVNVIQGNVVSMPTGWKPLCCMVWQLKEIHSI